MLSAVPEIEVDIETVEDRRLHQSIHRASAATAPGTRAGPSLELDDRGACPRRKCVISLGSCGGLGVHDLEIVDR